ncbi:hypothetical protein [Aegicerativicinus sediminis]|uniref:hypothetical protein n=1 Tax=Aegicerativicinus sediminis TaxID=2893202 RepID=UPI001E49ADE7|nr:hypothetical protein [Aegicerativicinus sediminis]
MLKALIFDRSLISILIILFSFICYGQDSQSVPYKGLNLTSAINGDLDLLWTLDQHHYRYFIRTSDGEIVELENNRIKGHKYDGAYKQTLSKYTNPTEKELKKLRFTLFHLSEFIDSQNTKADPNYLKQSQRAKIVINGSFLGGITNIPLFENPEDEILPQLGVELELIDEGNFPRHALYFQARQILKSDELNYQNTELAIGYRFKIIKNPNFNLFANLTFATLGFINAERSYYNVDNELVEEKIDNATFETPFSLGIGADFKVAKNGYISVQYNEVVAILVDNAGNFPKNILVGYKFKF